MRARAIDVRESIGRALSVTIFRADGKKLFPKGHLINEADLKLIEAEGVREVWVFELDEDEVGEDEAAIQLARVIGSGALEVRSAAGGRSNLFAGDACCVLVDSDLLKDINHSSSIAIATVWNWSYASPGQRVATVKSAPFAVKKDQLDGVLATAQARGPLIQGRPIHLPAVAVLYSDRDNGERARHLFERIMFQRLQRFAAGVSFVLSSQEQEEAVSHALAHLLRAKPTCVLIASTTAPAGPEDVVGRAMISAGCRIERFLAPVEPGSLLLLGYRDEIPVVAAPGCFRSPKTNVVDLILPPLLAKCPITAGEIASLGPVGLLTES
jgi:molybdenum cofactor cytidylyltransferase